MQPFKVVIAEKQKLIVELIKKSFEDIPGLKAVGDVDSSLNLVELLKKTPTDLIIMDIESLQDLNPVKEIKRNYPRVKILILTKEKSKEILLKAIFAGVDGYILTENTYSDLIVAINMIRQGGRFFSHIITEKLIDTFRGDMRDKIIMRNLSDREIEVLKLRCEGNSYKHIAECLSITTKTVAAHLEHIKKKLELRTNSDLREYLTEYGFLER